MTISLGSIGLDGADPMFRKNEPLDFRILRTCAVHFRHHRRYDCRSCWSENFPYRTPRLYGGEVTTRSTCSFGSWPVPSDNRRGGDGIESRKETDRSRSIRTAETVAGVVDAGPRSAIAATTIRAMAGCQCSELAGLENSFIISQWRTSPRN